jgi:hypothetical protein
MRNIIKNIIGNKWHNKKEWFFTHPKCMGQESHIAGWDGVAFGLLIILMGAFTLDVKSVLNENLGGILDGTQC